MLLNFLYVFPKKTKEVCIFDEESCSQFFSADMIICQIFAEALQIFY